MKLSTGILAIAVSSFNRAVAHASASQNTPQPFGFFTNNTIYQTVGNQSITYPRYVELHDGTIIATTSFIGPEPRYFPMFESTDGGASWTHISDLHDTANGWGMSAQPALAVLHSPLGDFPAGTILSSGNSCDADWSDVFAWATDSQGQTGASCHLWG